VIERQELPKLLSGPLGAGKTIFVADYGSVVVHVFHTSKREVYRLEELWNDAPRLKL